MLAPPSWTHPDSAKDSKQQKTHNIRTTEKTKNKRETIKSNSAGISVSLVAHPKRHTIGVLQLDSESVLALTYHWYW